MNKKISLIGCGNLGRAIVGGMVTSGKFSPNMIKASNRNKGKLEKIREDFRIGVSSSNAKVAAFGQVVILAVKPNKIGPVLEEIKEELAKSNPLIISIAAGIEINYLESFFDQPMRIMRTMPNIPAVVGEAMTALCPNDHCDQDDVNTAQEIFHSFGETEVVNEELLDVITAISGSSPAIVYLFIEAMADGAVLKGLSRDKAYRIISQSVLGAAKMVKETGDHPGALKDRVTSAAGTTIEALYSLEKRGFRGMLIEAVEKSTEKSQKISEDIKAAQKKKQK